jgi:hypothetical protein
METSESNKVNDSNPIMQYLSKTEGSSIGTEIKLEAAHSSRPGPLL